jgi:SAM-dependent methyltransferase
MKKEIYNQIQTIEQTHWWYVARRKIIFDWVFRALSSNPTPRVLDIGCGTGFNIEYLSSNGYSHVIGLDFSSESLVYCRSRNLENLACGDGARPPLRYESFDVIMALDLIEHLDNDVKALKELGCLLKFDGLLIIFTPAFNFLWSLQDEVGHHRRRYTAGELRQKLERAGLYIVKLTYVNMFLFPLIWAGRIALRIMSDGIQVVSENDLHPSWSNGLLQAIFAAERPLLRRMNFPFGASLLCVAKRRALPTLG